MTRRWLHLTALLVLCACTSGRETEGRSADPAPAQAAWVAASDAAPRKVVPRLKLPPEIEKQQAERWARSGKDPHETQSPPGCDASRLSIRSNQRDRTMLAVTELLARPETFELEHGRHQGQRALPISALLLPEDAGKTLAIHSCEGLVATLAAKDLLAQPSRYVVVTNSSGSLKLLDLANPASPERIAKDVIALVLEDGAGGKGSP